MTASTECKEVMEFVIWNPEKLNNFLDCDSARSADDYLALVEYEQRTNSSLSSSLFVSSLRELEAMLEAIYNETDCQLCYQYVRLTYA